MLIKMEFQEEKVGKEKENIILGEENK